MADLDLKPSNNRWDLIAENGDLKRTGSAKPAILRRLLQGPTLADDGERTGDCLNDVTLIDSGTDGRVRRIVETRLGGLFDRGDLQSVDVLRVETGGGQIVAQIQVKEPGQEPEVIPVRLMQ